MILSSHSLSEGRLRGREGSARGRLCNTLTNRVTSGPDGCRENGSLLTRSTICFARQIMISLLNGSFFAIAARREDSLTSSRTTNVPTAPMFTTPNFDNCLAIIAGRHVLVPPTLTARRKTTEDIAAKSMELGARRWKLEELGRAKKTGSHPNIWHS